jgi:hypothetical protein
MSLINVGCRLERETHKQLRMMCLQRGLNLQDLIKLLLTKWMEDNKENGKK